jgi:hypothetical protein
MTGRHWINLDLYDRLEESGDGRPVTERRVTDL